MNVNANTNAVMSNTCHTKCDNVTSNWSKSIGDGTTYSYYNPYPRLHHSPISEPANNQLKIGQINIRSLPKHYEELCLLPSQQFDILCMSETWLNSYHSDQSIEIALFPDPIRHDRADVNKSRGGGSMIYYKLGLQCTPLPQLEAMFSPNIDSTWIKIKTNRKPIIVGTFYKPPDASNAQLLQSLENLFLHQTVNQCDVIIAGDYNID